MAQLSRHFAGPEPGIRGFHGELTRRKRRFDASLSAGTDDDPDPEEKDAAMPRPSLQRVPQTALTWSSPDTGRGRGLSGRRAPGLNFSALDPLCLAPDFTVTAPLPGAPEHALLLAERLASFLTLSVALTFSTGAHAIRHTLAALLGPADDVIIDAGADPAMFDPVLKSATRLHRCPPGSVDAVERRLVRLSRQPRKGRLFLIVPAIARLSSVAADLADLCALCARHNATLIVDVSQDMGVIGPSGQGMAEVQGRLGQIDVILGNLAGAFAAPGGFAAFRDPALADRVRAHPARPQPLASAFATPILAALDLMTSPEGARRRRLLHGNALRLRNHLMADELRVMGHPSPVVPVRLPVRKVESVTALLRSAGTTVPILRAPDVAGHAPRWHIRLNAGHGPADIDDLADLLRDVTRAADRGAGDPRRLEAAPQPWDGGFTEAVT
jgi:glycine C-acetyltransferase